MQVVVVIGDVIGQGRDLRLAAGVGMQLKIVTGVVVGQRVRHRITNRTVARNGRNRTIMFGDPFQRFPSQVQPVPFGIMALQIGDDTNGLRVMIETAVGGHQGR